MDARNLPNQAAVTAAPATGAMVALEDDKAAGPGLLLACWGLVALIALRRMVF